MLVRPVLKLRAYQSQMIQDIHAEWLAGNQNVLAVLPTGGGKTVVFASILAAHTGASCAIAHRQELVGQMSVALARLGVRHNIIAPAPLVRAICALHILETGASYYDPNSPCAVAGVDTLVRKGEQLAKWFASVTLWVQDEAHHVLIGNKWGTASGMFTHPECRGLGVTATPIRADGKGLGSCADGLFDVMVTGPTMRTLINDGYLTDYRVVVAMSDIKLLGTVGASGDWSPAQLKAAARESHIIGDVVATYRKWALGKLAVVFAPDVDTATRMAAKFNADGIPTAAVSANTPGDVRRGILEDFKHRRLHVLINVDLFGEGFDLPAIEVVIMARPTESFSLFAQQFGRALRLMIAAAMMAMWDALSPAERSAHIAASSKPRALIIDHVGNLVRHQGPPDARNDWTLESTRGNSREKPTDVDALAFCANPECADIYPAYMPKCPHCKVAPVPGSRSTPDAVMGDMQELDPDVLAAMRGAVDNGPARTCDAVREELTRKGLPMAWVMSNVKKHDNVRQSYLNLKDATEWLFGEWQAEGLSRSEIYRRFYLRYGVDVLSAYALPREQADKLAARIDAALRPENYLGRWGCVTVTPCA